MDLSSSKVFADERNTFTEAGNEKQVSSSSLPPDGQMEKKKAGNSNQVEITLIGNPEERKIISVNSKQSIYRMNKTKNFGFVKASLLHNPSNHHLNVHWYNPN